MEEFERRLRSAKPEARPSNGLSDLVMARIADKRPGWDWLDGILAGCLVVSVALLVIYSISNDLGPLLSLVFTDFDVVSKYPTDFLAALAETIPWLYVITTALLSFGLVWHTRVRRHA